MNRMSPRVLALLLALTLMWGTNWALFRIALDELPVATFRSGVLAVGGIVLGILLLLRGESFRVPKGRWPMLVLAALLNLLIWNVATSMAVLYMPSGHASMLAYTMPLWVALIGFVVYGQRLTGRLLLALLIGAGRVAALMIPNFSSYARAPLGLFWGLLAALSWAIGTYVVKRTDWGGLGMALTFWQVVISLPPIVLGMLLIDGLPTHWPSTPTVLVTVYTGAGPMALGTLAWFSASTTLYTSPTQSSPLLKSASIRRYRGDRSSSRRCSARCTA